MEIFSGAGAPLINYIAEPWERDAPGCLEMNLPINPYYPFATREEYEYSQCGIKKKGMKTYNANVLNDENTALRFANFKNGSDVQEIVATMPDDLALGECELHTLQHMRWNVNDQRPIKCSSRDIIKSMR